LYNLAQALLSYKQGCAVIVTLLVGYNQGLVALLACLLVPLYKALLACLLVPLLACLLVLACLLAGAFGCSLAFLLACKQESKATTK
jgi:hypothetical protein